MSSLIQATEEQTASAAGDDWLEVPQVAAWIKTGTRSIYRAIARKELRAVKVNGRGDLRIARRWVIDWMERRAA